MFRLIDDDGGYAETNDPLIAYVMENVGGFHRCTLQEYQEQQQKAQMLDEDAGLVEAQDDE